MKKQFLLFSTVFIASFSLLSSCQKDDNLPVIKTKTQLLTQKTWKFSSATLGGTDMTASVPACQKDNVTSFITGGTGSGNEGATKCNVTDPQTVSFTWSFQSGETMLTTSSPLIPGTTTGSSTSTIVSLTETELKLSQPVTIGPTTQTAVATFVH
ncbi:MAG: hypothetical protein SGI96_07350 [Bacteroidota bacterium]|nr:hypothetical protein [Bacteroidota bacterium]